MLEKDITRVFDSETLILGVLSGLIGVGTAYLLTFPINMLIESLTDLKNVAILDPVHAVVLLIISTVLTVIGGHIPARMAAKKMPLKPCALINVVFLILSNC